MPYMLHTEYCTIDKWEYDLMLLWMPGFTASWHDAKTISSFLLIYIWALNYYEAISADVEARYDTCIYLRSL